jgi:hypothetical protein
MLEGVSPVSQLDTLRQIRSTREKSIFASSRINTSTPSSQIIPSTSNPLSTCSSSLLPLPSLLPLRELASAPAVMITTESLRSLAALSSKATMSLMEKTVRPLQSLSACPILPLAARKEALTATVIAQADVRRGHNETIALPGVSAESAVFKLEHDLFVN